MAMKKGVDIKLDTSVGNKRFSKVKIIKPIGKQAIIISNKPIQKLPKLNLPLNKFFIWSM